MQIKCAFLCMLALAFVLHGVGYAATLDVCPSPAGTYTTIQNAVNAAADSDTINLCAATYRESVSLKVKNVHLAGPIVGTAAIVCPSSTVDGVAIKASGVQVTALDISGCANAITVGATTATVRNNTIHDNDVGISLGTLSAGTIVMLNRMSSNASAAIQDKSALKQNILVGNTIDGTPGTSKTNYGIYISGIGALGGDTVQYNTVRGTSQAITLAGASSSTIQQNVTNGNALGILLTGSTLLKSTNNQLTGNLAENSTVTNIRADTKTSGNTFSRNLAHNNNGVAPTSFDIQDLSKGSGTAATANTWDSNVCDTSSPAGMCSPPDPYQEQTTTP